MECFTLGISIVVINNDMVNYIKNNPDILFYSSGVTSYICWNVMIPVGCLKLVFDRWLISAPWTKLLTSFRELNEMTGTITTPQITYGNIRVYLKYSSLLPNNLRGIVPVSQDMISYGIKIRNTNQNIIDAVNRSENLQLYISGEEFYLAWMNNIETGSLKVNIDAWLNNIPVNLLVDEINRVLSADNRKNINILSLRLYGKYQLSYPYASKIKLFAS